MEGRRRLSLLQAGQRNSATRRSLVNKTKERLIAMMPIKSVRQWALLNRGREKNCFYVRHIRHGYDANRANRCTE